MFSMIYIELPEFRFPLMSEPQIPPEPVFFMHHRGFLSGIWGVFLSGFSSVVSDFDGIWCLFVVFWTNIPRFFVVLWVESCVCALRTPTAWLYSCVSSDFMRVCACARNIFHSLLCAAWLYLYCSNNFMHTYSFFLTLFVRALTILIRVFVCMYLFLHFVYSRCLTLVVCSLALKKDLS